MKKHASLFSLITLTFLILLMLFLPSCNEDSLNPALVREFSLTSASNGATYQIKVVLPENFESSGKKRAAIYLLDGEENINLVANRCKEISLCKATENVVVVSIGYGRNRNMDYTPTSKTSKNGGAPEFMAFIGSQLIPKMEQDFPVDTARSARVILGHSFGGLLGAYAFATHNKVFGNYILLSPSLWFDNEVTMLYEKENRAGMQTRQQLVFMGQGALENSGRMQAPFEAFYQTLVKSYSNIRIGRHLEKDMDHVGSKNPNICHGLEFYFENRK